MTVGVLRLEFSIPEARSLKEKRSALLSVKERLASKFNVSVAEVDAQDLWQRAVLGVALVGTDGRFVGNCLDQIVEWVRRQRKMVLVEIDREIVS
jgi:hypothetical protein